MKIYLNDAKGNLHFKCQTIMSQPIQMLQDCSLSGYGFLPHAADTVLTQDLGALEPAKHIRHGDQLMPPDLFSVDAICPASTHKG